MSLNYCMLQQAPDVDTSLNSHVIRDAPKTARFPETTYVCTASSVSNVNVLPLLTWNTYNFMLNSPLSFRVAWLLHLVCDAHLRRKRIRVVYGH